jgi:hypothetical protein
VARNETDDAAELRPANLDARVADLDAFDLDTYLRDAMQTIRTAAPRIGQWLQLRVDHRLYRPLGFQSVDAYVQERLGVSPRTAWTLIKVEKAAWRALAFADAYAGGTFSWARADAAAGVRSRDGPRVDRAPARLRCASSRTR